MSSVCSPVRFIALNRTPLGLIELRNLRVRKGALDKFKLPVDVVEGTSKRSIVT